MTPATTDDRPLAGRVALVAGATRGTGRAIAVELARAGASVYATGRSSRVDGPSDMDRPETIEETGDLMASAGGDGAALVVDHLDVAAVRGLVDRVRAEQGRLDVLVHDIFGRDRYAQWGRPLWEHDLEGGLRMLRMGVDTHLVTSTLAIPLMLDGGSRGGLVVEVTDGTSEVNATRRPGVGFYYDLVKANVDRIVAGLAAETADLPLTALGVTPRHDRFAGRVLTARQLADTYGVTDADGSRPDCWGLIRDHGWDEDPAVIDDYR